MIISRFQLLFVFSIFIGSGRFLVYSHNNSEDQNSNGRESDTNTSINNCEDADQKNPIRNCQADSDYVKQQTTLVARMLSDSKKMSEKLTQHISTDETVVVLGKTGIGKSSLIQFLTQNPKLQSKKIRTNTGEYIIDDEEKIGTSVTESTTLYPELVNHKNSSLTFCDLPGFHDSRSSAHEIVSMAAMKSTISRFNKIKILLLENYNSLQYSLSKDNFINTLRYLKDFLIDFDKYKDHIVLIATKTPSTYKMTDDNSTIPEFITEEIHIESILEFLSLTETSLAKKVAENINRNDNEFYRNVIKLLKCLQIRDKDGKATRINVFRRPYKSGHLMNMPLLKKNKESLIKTITHLNSVEVGKNDFDLPLSDKAKVYLQCLLKLASDSYQSTINEVFFKMNRFVKQKVQNHTSYYQLLLDLETLHSTLKELSINLDTTKNYNELFREIDGFISKLDTPLHYDENEDSLVLAKYTEMLSNITETSLQFSTSALTLPLRQVIESTEEEMEWYRMVNIYIEGLSSYNIQANKTEIHSSIFKKDSTSMKDLLGLVMSITGSNNESLRNLFEDDIRKRSELESITKTLLQQNHIECSANGRLVVEGFLISISEINSEDLVHSHCYNTIIKEVSIQAAGTLFVDENTIDMFREVNMFIVAPKWEVIGQRRIVLSGWPGPEVSADNPYVENGKDGKPGRPGGNGGNFSGIGLQFVNGKNLRIESNGGQGGPGANGAKGAAGLDGRDASEKMKLGMYSEDYTFHSGVKTDDLKSSLSSQSEEEYFSQSQSYTNFSEKNFITFSSRFNVITEDGDCGGNGMLGGLGGESGLGGLPGDLQLIELGDSSQVEIQNQNGSRGLYGNMGETGDRGTDGKGMICVQVMITSSGSYMASYKTTTYWKCKSRDVISPACNTCQTPIGTSEYTTTGIEQPTAKKPFHLGQNLLDYSSVLGVHYFNPIFHQVLSDFKKAVLQKNPTLQMRPYHFFFQEFRGMLRSIPSKMSKHTRYN